MTRNATIETHEPHRRTSELATYALTDPQPRTPDNPRNYGLPLALGRDDAWTHRPPLPLNPRTQCGTVSAFDNTDARGMSILSSTWPRRAKVVDASQGVWGPDRARPSTSHAAFSTRPVGTGYIRGYQPGFPTLRSRRCRLLQYRFPRRTTPRALGAAMVGIIFGLRLIRLPLLTLLGPVENRGTSAEVVLQSGLPVVILSFALLPAETYLGQHLPTAWLRRSGVHHRMSQIAISPAVVGALHLFGGVARFVAGASAGCVCRTPSCLGCRSPGGRPFGARRSFMPVTTPSR